jgi:hypothetical protein
LDSSQINGSLKVSLFFINLRQSFIFLNYFISALGIACLVFSEVFPGAVYLGLYFALSACFYYESKGRIPLEPPVQLSIWKIGAAFFVFFYFLGDLPILPVLVSFLILIMFIKLVFKSELNDYLYGYLIGIVYLLIGAIYARGLSFGVLFLTFYLVLCWVLILYNLVVRKVGSHAPPNKFRLIGRDEIIEWPLFSLAGGLVFGSLILTVIIFVSFPRVELGFFSIGSNSHPLTGFSEKVTLGEVGSIKESTDVVMRVEFSKEGKKVRPDGRFLWRGVALDLYDGKSWGSTAGIDWQMEKTNPKSGLDLFAPSSSKKLFKQEIFMEPFDSDVVFTSGIPIHINGSFRGLELDRNFVLRTSEQAYGPKKLVIVSEMKSPLVSYINPEPFRYDNYVLRRFLQLPSLSPEIKQLAESLSGSNDSGFEKADNILNYLKTGFGYSLEMVKQTQLSGLDEFLFVRKRGHCEYFASAMAVLLRLQGIPTKLVNGFVGTEWNDLGDYMVVRQKHAHSWVEAYFPGYGWRVYDPTPPDPLAVFQKSNLLSSYMDVLRLNWQRYVIRYSFKDQVRLASFIGSEGKSLKEKFKKIHLPSWKEIWQAYKDHGKFVLILVWFFVMYKLFFAFSFSHLSRKWRSEFAVLLYEKLIARLERSGFPKKPAWTHREFLKNLKNLPPEKFSVVEEVICVYEKARFASGALGDKEKKEIWIKIQNI